MNFKLVFLLISLVFKLNGTNKCPDTLYYADLEPLISSPKEQNANKLILNQLLIKKPSLQHQPNGLIWDIINKSYETCCPDTKLKSHLTNDDFNQYHEIFKLNQTSHGIFTFNLNQDDDLFKKLQIFKSEAFYLIAKRDQSGASLLTPIALDILISSWPILLIILIANCYAAMFIWFIDKSLKTNQFPKSFAKGCCFGLWWSFLVFSSTSLAPGINMRTCILKLFTVIWVLISGILVCIFIGMFSTSLTLYALNGQALNRKLIGINKYALNDKIWLEYENAIVIEYQSTQQMFTDLQSMKLDYILLDQLIAASLYSKQIKENEFYLMRKVEREQVFDLILNGFSLEQLSCLRSAVSLYMRQWLKLNLSLIRVDNRLDSASFNLTDELLYPKRNLILITSLIVLVLFFLSGLLWQSYADNSSNQKKNKQLTDSNNKTVKLASNSFLKKFKTNKKFKLFNERKDYSFNNNNNNNNVNTNNDVNNKKRKSLDTDYSTSLLNLNFNQIERSIHEEQHSQHQPVYRYLDSATTTDRSVKFNPLVHNIYFTDKSSQLLDSNPKDLISRETNNYFNLPLSYLPHAAIQPNFNNSFYSSPPKKKLLNQQLQQQEKLKKSDFLESLTRNKDEELACNDCYYLNEIINFKL